MRDLKEMVAQFKKFPLSIKFIYNDVEYKDEGMPGSRGNGVCDLDISLTVRHDGMLLR